MEELSTIRRDDKVPANPFPYGQDFAVNGEPRRGDLIVFNGTRWELFSAPERPGRYSLVFVDGMPRWEKAEA